MSASNQVNCLFKKRTMLSQSLEDFSDPLSEILKPSPGWGSCPLEVLIMVFEHLSPEDLINCIRVNNWWRDAVDYIGQHCAMWPSLAQAGMTGGGLTFKKRSTLGWRELYLNSRLWKHLNSAEVTWDYVLHAQEIRYVHVYKDYLILQIGEYLEILVYKIDTDGGMYRDVTDNYLIRIEEEKLERTRRDDDDDIFLFLSTNRRINESSDLDVDRMVMKIIKQGPFRRLALASDNCFYILNEKNMLMCFNWLEDENKWSNLVLARYYGCTSTIADIHIHNDEIYLMLVTGMVFRLNRNLRNFEPLMHLNNTLYGLLNSLMISVDKLDTALPRVCDLKLPTYKTGNTIMFHKYAAIVGVPSDRDFKITQDKDNVILECPELTCATHHGDVLLLGFKNGNVEIGLIKTLISGGKAEVRENVQYYHNYLDDRPAIVSIGVYEVEKSHKVFVATRSHLYQLVIQYPEHILSAFYTRP